MLEREKREEPQYTGLEVAVIGMAGRFPGANTLEAFWENIANGRDSIAHFTSEELLENGVEPSQLQKPNYVKAKGFIEDVEYFDAAFFNYSEREAAIMDPQMRVLQECAWEALESAGYLPHLYKGKIGLFAGASTNFSWMELTPLGQKAQGAALAEAGTLAYKDALGTLLAYKLGLKGPAFSLYTACSTSALGIHLACRSLITGECDLALAGGVSITYPKKHGYIYEEGMTSSPDGRVRPFDARAAGAVFSDGAGIVLLKRLVEALQDGDTIHAVIKGSAVNNDGARKVGYTAPSVEGQAEIITMAQNIAEVEPETITYVETHGTATPLGDTIEFEALKRAFAGNKKSSCAIGSVKGNIGHVNTASGVAGFIKTALALQHKQIPPSLYFEHPNPKIDFVDSPFYVSTELEVWDTNMPRRAGVSSFGYGGTNVHIVLEEAPPRQPTPTRRSYQMVTLSARTPSALEKSAQNLVRSMSARPDIALADVAYTLHLGRQDFAHRQAIVCTSRDDMLEQLANISAKKSQRARADEKRELGLLFCPDLQSEKNWHALHMLYQGEPLVREHVDHCFGLLQTIAGIQLDRVLEKMASCSGEGSGEVDPLTHFFINFAFEYALSRSFLEVGIKPLGVMAAGLAHAVAACVAGILTLEDALRWGGALVRLLADPEKQALQQHYEQVVQNLRLNKPQFPLISALTGSVVKDLEVQDRGFWLQLARQIHRYTPLELWPTQAEPNARHVVILQLGESSAEQERWLQGSRLEVWQLLGQGEEASGPGSGFLNMLARLWENGQAIHWQKLYKGESRSRLPLPTYPFEKKRFWIDAPGRSLSRPDRALEKLPDIADWFYLPGWQEKSAPQAEEISSATWLLLQDRGQVGAQLGTRLKAQGHRVVTVHAGSAFKQLGENEFVICGTRWEDYQRVLTESGINSAGLLRILHVWTAEAQQFPGESHLDNGFYTLIYLAKALAWQQFGQQFEVNVLTNQLYKVKPTDQVVPEKATLLAPIKVMPQEYFHVRCRCIDFDLAEFEQGLALEALLKEIALKMTDTEVAYRDGQRYIRTYQPIAADRLRPALALPLNQGVPLLREGGVYVISGGLGGIGLRLARYLASVVQANLALLSRGELPAREEWSSWLEQNNEDDRISFRIRQLQELEAAGASVLVIAADVADEEQVRHALQKVETTFGRIDGIIHAAGILHIHSAKRPLETIEREDCEEQFRPKMHGLKVLDKLLKHRQLDFRLVVSSLSPILGGLGFVAYAAANLYMDAFIAQQSADEAQPWIGVNWGDWQYSGPRLQRRIARTAIDALEMSTEEALKTFQCVLMLENEKQIVISSGDLFVRLKQWIQLEASQQGIEAPPVAGAVARAPGINSRQIGDQERLEQIIVDLWLSFYHVQTVERATNFFELGATSLDIIQLHTQLVNILQRHIPIEAMFENPTIAQLAAALSSEAQPEVTAISVESQGIRSQLSTDIAVIGFAGRFPGAASVDELWDNLASGLESIRIFTDEELEEAGVRSEDLRNPNYRKAKGYLEGTEYFDASFFDYTPRDASLMDPQLRIFHECAWSALENAGYRIRDYQGKIGVFAGASSSLYWQVLSLLAEGEEPADLFLTSLLANKDSLSTQISYKFNLNGPSVNIFSGCSTSMVAIDAACNGILNGQCDMAIAGGVTVALPEKSGYLYQEGMLFSADGHCCAFDARASGMVFGDGVGIVVLKSLDRAIADGDTIHAVVKGTATNNDGHRKMGYTAPSVDGQAEVIRQALSNARVEPESVGYLETHGTGTQLGDVIEVAALKKVFGGNNRLPLGSIKTNVGHLNAASGVAGFIKAVLCLEKRMLPPSLHFETPNPQIDFNGGSFYVNTRLQEWRNERYPLRAGVSSFGIGGTNAHAILEQAPPIGPSDEEQEWKLLCLSAKTEAALERMTDNLAEYLRLHPDCKLSDIAYTLHVGRQAFAYRRTLVCRTRQEAMEALTRRSEQLRTAQAVEKKHAIVFMFPGNGGQYVNMARELYEKEDAFRTAMDACFTILSAQLGIDVKGILYSELSDNQTQDRGEIQKMAYSQPAIFCLEYALATLLMQRGIQPSAMIGYSFGEYVAACLAGVFSLRDALFLVVTRGRLMSGLPEGAMLSVPLAEEQIIPLLDEFKVSSDDGTADEKQGLMIAIDNGPSCLVSGATQAIARFERFLRKKRIVSMRIASEVAAHSAMLEDVANQFAAQLKNVSLHCPHTPFVSGITGTWITDEEAQDPGYWARHMKETVRFAQGITELMKNPNHCFVEVGPGHDLSVLLQRFVEQQTRLIQPMIRPQSQQASDVQYLLGKLAALWAYGLNVDWAAIYQHERRRRLPLPTYAFERISYKREGNPFALRQSVEARLEPKEEIRKYPDISRWFYVPRWRSDLLPVTMACVEHQIWLIFADRYGIASALAEKLQRLQNAQQTVVLVEPGDTFACVDVGLYRLNHRDQAQYHTLMAELQFRGLLPDRVLHCSSLVRADERQVEVNVGLDEGFYSFLFLVKALTNQAAPKTVDIRIVTNGTQSIVGEERLIPAHACMIGPAIVVTQEVPYVRCSVIDITVPESGSLLAQKLPKQLLTECLMEAGESVVAYRGEHRWVRDYQPLKLEKPAPGALRLKCGGVYLITGAFGGIGKILARYLARIYQARLVLVAREGLPERVDWQSWLGSRTDERSISAKIRFVQELEELGAGVMVASGDVADKAKMAEIIQETERHFGTINGVIHAAGLLGDETFKVLKELEVDDCEKQFQAKLRGVLVLDELLREKQLDFCLLMSSIASVLGGLGYGAYTAANLFMDAFASQQAQRTLVPWYVVNWSDWKHWDDTGSQNALGQSVNRLSMLPEEGLDAFERILACTETQIVHSPGNLDLRIKQWIKLDFVREQENDAEQQRHPRAALSTPYAEPRDEIERHLAEIWAAIFKVQEIGIHDDFFELGGDSLKGVMVVSRIHKELGVEVPISQLFSTPALSGLAGFVQHAQHGELYTIPVAPHKESYPLSSAQKRLYILHQIHPDSTAYNDVMAYVLEGELDIVRFERIFQQIVERHESLRTSFELSNGEPVQKIQPLVRFDLFYQETTEETARDLVRRFVTPFDLRKAPLMRVGLLKIGATRHILVLDIHHIITDGVSYDCLVRDFIALYQGKMLPPLQLQYKDYAEWQCSEQTKALMAQQETYWLKKFAGSLPSLNLMTDYARPPVQSFLGESLKFELGQGLTERLKKAVVAHNSTVYMHLLSTLKILLFKYTGQNDLIVGSPVAGRSHPDLQNIIGIFVNMLPIRTFPTQDQTFIHYLHEVQQTALEAFENDAYQYDDLISRLGLHGILDKNPLFSIVFVLQNMNTEQLSVDDIKVTGYDFTPGRAQFDLLFRAVEIDGNLVFTVEYATVLFRHEFIVKMVSRYLAIIEETLAHPETTLEDITIPHDLQIQEKNVQQLAKEDFVF